MQSWAIHFSSTLGLINSFFNLSTRNINQKRYIKNRAGDVLMTSIKTIFPKYLCISITWQDFHKYLCTNSWQYFASENSIPA